MVMTTQTRRKLRVLQIGFSSKHYINKKFVSGNREGEPIYVDVCVNDANVSTELDTGTYETVISEKILHNHFKNVNIFDTLTNLRGYDSTVMNPVGKLSNLNVKFRNKNCMLVGTYCRVQVQSS